MFGICNLRQDKGGSSVLVNFTWSYKCIDGRESGGAYCSKQEFIVRKMS